MLLLSDIELANGVDADAFGEFFRDEFLPSVHTGPTRVGQIQEVELLERATSETDRSFAVLVRWSGMSGGRTVRADDAAVQEKLEKLAVIKDPVVWQVAAKLPDA